MTGTASGTSEVWLRSNPRPAVAGAVVVALAVAVAATALVACGGPAWGWWVLAAAGAVTGAVAMGQVVAASLPRIVRRGDALRVRMSPLTVYDVPLEIVECVFPGSSTLEGREVAPRRVGTVVIRLAERAVAWQQRPTFAAWGTWSDGHVVIDGRWCEPLSLEVTKQLGQRILEAKRGVAAPRPEGKQACR